MWQKLSLRARLNALLALVMVLGLFINITRLLLEAGPRVAAEDQSVVRLARGFVETLVSDLNDRPDPEAVRGRDHAFEAAPCEASRFRCTLL